MADEANTLLMPDPSWSSFPRKRESIFAFDSRAKWIPACAGMTPLLGCGEVV